MKTKVLYIFGGEQASGAEIVIEALMAKSIDHVEPHLFISPGRFSEKLIALQKPYVMTVMPQLRKLNRSKSGKAAFVLKALRNYFVISSMALKYVRKHTITTVHANTIVPACYLIPAILFAKVFHPKLKWIWSDHDMVYFKKMDHYFASLCGKLYDKTLVVSKAVKLKYGNNPKVEILYNGLDTMVYKPDVQARNAFRNQWNVKEQTILFAIAGIISPRKRQLELMEAFGKIETKGANVLLFLAGDFGPDDLVYNEKVKALTAQQPNVHYMGHIDNMVEFYNGCDVIVNNSSDKGSEPFGATIYEAMSCQTLVMAADTGGLPELVDHQKNGFLFAPDNMAALVEMMEYIVQNFYNTDVVRKAARDKVIQKFGFDAIVDQYKGILGITNRSAAKVHVVVA